MNRNKFNELVRDMREAQARFNVAVQMGEEENINMLYEVSVKLENLVDLELYKMGLWNIKTQ